MLQTEVVVCCPLDLLCSDHIVLRGFSARSRTAQHAGCVYFFQDLRPRHELHKPMQSRCLSQLMLGGGVITHPTPNTIGPWLGSYWRRATR